LATAAKEMGLKTGTNETELLIQAARAEKRIHSITLMGKTTEAHKNFV
jgi:hypothetical protein